MPMVLLSGIATPINNMPEILQLCTWADPLRFAVDGVRRIYLEGAALGDLSENAEYDAARQEQAQVESKIAELEMMLEKATIVKNTNKDTIGIGSTVKICYVDDDEEEEYTIVGSKEVDPFAGKISNESPIAQAILNHKVNDIVDVASPAGSYPVKILEIC